MNLVIALLVARTHVPRSRIREVVDGYGDQADDAFQRMFERDKDELRALGVPIETGSVDSYFDDEPGYLIRRERFELPPVDLEPDEVAVLGLAARVWEQAGLAAATTSALRKLGAAGVRTDRAVLGAVEARLGAAEPAFEGLFGAAVTRRAVAFDYRGGGLGEVRHRRVEPWGLGLWHGRWYLVGFDRDRGERRLFRLGRVVGAVAVQGEGGAFGPPPPGAVRDALATLELTHGAGPGVPGGTGRAEPAEPATAALRIRAGAGLGLRRRVADSADPKGTATATATSTATDGNHAVPPGWDRVEVPFADADAFAEEVVGYGADAVVLGPPELRDAVVARFRAVLEALPAARVPS